METSLAGGSDGKPAFWPSGVRSSLQTAARTRRERVRAHQIGSKREALRAKSSSSVRRGPPGRPKSATRSAHSPTQRGATGADCATEGCVRGADSRFPKPHRRIRIPPPSRAPAPPRTGSPSCTKPKPPRSIGVRALCPPEVPSASPSLSASNRSFSHLAVSSGRASRRRGRQISIVDSLILRPES